MGVSLSSLHIDVLLIVFRDIGVFDVVYSGVRPLSIALIHDIL